MKMLPAIFVTFATFLLELSISSPVYNMQPAFITANIGTAGRNIRNLPCISRKSNQSGVCMFAIECVKANGTHLGTCIDRFYFGSCCHIEPVHDIIDNNIDSDIIPAREPPQRLSSTLRPLTSLKTESTTFKANLTTTQQPETTATAGYKLTTFQSVETSSPTDSTTIQTSSKTSTTLKPTKSTAKPTKTSPKPTRTTVTTRKPSSSITRKPTTATKKPTLTKTTSTVKPSKTTTRKPTSTTVTPKLNTTTSKPVATSASKKPVTATTKPTKLTTITSSVKPSTTTTLKPTTTEKSSNSSSNKVTTSSSTLKPSVTSSSSLKPSVTTSSSSLKPSVTSSSTLKPSVTSSSSLKPSVTTPSSSLKPSVTPASSIVTWTNIDTNRNVSVATTTGPPNSTSEDWQPLTTLDNWVPLPSVKPETAQPETASTLNVSTSTESASKASVTYAPLESTSSSLTLNASSTASAGIVTSQSPVTALPSSTPTTAATPDIRPVNMSDFTDVCGRRMYPEGRIVGGEKSSFGKWPWQISLRQWRTSTYLHKCGAALLNENWAITAAHCVDNVPPSDLLLRLGEHDLSTESEPYLHQERRVQIVASHPQFDPRTFEYDLALLRFYEPVTFQPNILPVCVPQSDENFVGRTAYVTGWGRLYEDGPLPSILQEVSVPVINNSVCESMYRSAGYIEHIPHIFICAGWRRGGFDSCEGDSGGPMVIQREDKRFLLAGVISWGIGCAEPNQPGVYTRISEFRDWINQILQF